MHDFPDVTDVADVNTRPARHRRARPTTASSSEPTSAVPQAAARLSVESARRTIARTTPSPSLLRGLLILADVTALVLGFVLAFGIQMVLSAQPFVLALDHMLLALASVPGFALGAVINHLYLSRANERPSEEFGNIVRAVAVGIVSILVIAFATKYSFLSRLWVFSVAITVTGSLCMERVVARHMFQRLRANGRLRRPILIVGTDTHAIALMHMYRRHPHLGYDVIGFVGSDPLAARADVKVLGDLDDISELVKSSGAVGVVISMHSVDADQVNSITRELTDARVHVSLSSSLRDIDITRFRPQQLAGCTLIYIEQVIRGGWRARAKRLFDVSVAALMLALTAPVVALAAALVKATSHGPVLFRQTRVGKDGELFEILKLRTMTADAEDRKAELLHANEADGPLFKMAADPRITRVGKWLRKLSLDELPQLVCVMRGTMSMVGPRPALPDEVARWDPEVRQRLRVLPGLTGLWQISGRSDSSFDQYKRLDLYYVDNWCLSHDLKICAKTVGVVLSGRGAS